MIKYYIMRLEYKPENNNNELNTAPEEHVLSQGTSVNEEIRHQSKKMKDKPLKEKLSYFVEYYKWPVLAAIIIIGVLTSIIYTVVSSKDSCFYAMIVNSTNIDSEKLIEGFSTYAQLDTDHYDCLIEANSSEVPNATGMDMSTSTRFAANISTGELDIVIYDSENFDIKSSHDLFVDLRDILSKEEIQKYEPYFYYMVTTDSNESVPVGIVVSDSNLVSSINAYYGLTPVFGVLKNSQRIDTAVAFLNYIFDSNIDFSSMKEY